MKRLDPVCGMEVDAEEACTREVDGEIHYFCSEGCRDRFLGDQKPGKQRCEYDLIVVGGGPAGLTAAVYASMLKIDTFVIAQDLGGRAATRRSGMGRMLPENASPRESTSAAWSPATSRRSGR